MGDVILRSHGLELHRFKPVHVMPFYEQLSEENKREFKMAYELDPLEAILRSMQDQMVFVVMRGEKILALTGVDDGCMWSMFSKEMPKYWVRFVRASHDLINYYHHFYDSIHCDVWTENEMIHQWLSHLGFGADTFISVENGQQLIRFVRCKTKQDNVHSFLSRPVMH